MARPSCGRRSSTGTADRAASAPPTRRCGSTRSPGRPTTRTSRTATRASGSSSAARLPPAPRARTSTGRSSPTRVVGGTIFEGSGSVWRTQDWGGEPGVPRGELPRVHAPRPPDPACGDFVRIGPSGNTNLTAASYGTRAGGAVSAIARTTSDNGTVWAATGTGRVFISHNADAAAGSVTWTRLDTLPSASADPNRAVSGIYVDPANSNHAWISLLRLQLQHPEPAGSRLLRHLQRDE